MSALMRAEANWRPCVLPDLLAGRFAVDGELGRGRMGRVLAARDIDLGRRVAIKLLSGRPDPRKLERLKREARALGQLDHPNVLVIHDAGVHDGEPFLVTELLEGQTLRERMHAQPLPFQLALDLGTQLAHALAAVHDKGVVHRDLKPENLFLTSEGRLKILDFGTARLSNEESQADSRPNRDGAIVGTVGYMAPEQVRGGRADERSDLFAAGCLLYEMLSGKRCFARPTAALTAFATLEDDPRRFRASRRDRSAPSSTVAWRKTQRAGSSPLASSHSPSERWPPTRLPAVRPGVADPIAARRSWGRLRPMKSMGNRPDTRII